MLKNRFQPLENDEDFETEASVGLGSDSPLQCDSASSTDEYFDATSSPLMFSAPRVRPTPVHFPRERRVIGTIGEPNDEAHRRTSIRVDALKQVTQKLSQWTEAPSSHEKVLELEKELIDTCEILIKLRENFACWHYSKLVQDNDSNSAYPIPIKTIRNIIVHHLVTKPDANKREFYFRLSQQLATLRDYEPKSRRNPLKLNDFIIPGYIIPRDEVYRLAYTDSVQATLDTLFKQMVNYAQQASSTPLLMTIACATEIIRQLLNQDPTLITQNRLKINGQSFDAEILPYMLQVRSGIYHYFHPYEKSSVDEIVLYAQSIQTPATPTHNLRIVSK